MWPLRVAAEALCALFNGDNATRIVTITKDDSTVVFTAGFFTYLANGASKQLGITA